MTITVIVMIRFVDALGPNQRSGVGIHRSGSHRGNGTVFLLLFIIRLGSSRGDYPLGSHARPSSVAIKVTGSGCCDAGLQSPGATSRRCRGA
jgi:hypothetical protein